jgi:predicted DNA-binding protein with PD1-like motif
MQSAKEGNNIILKLEDGEDMFKCLNAAFTSQSVKALAVEFGIGMLRDFTIGYFNGSEYEKWTIQKPMELVALHGLVAQDSTHLHCAVADSTHSIIGGHLFEATVNVVNEILLLRLDSINIKRQLNETTGLMELQFE